MGEGISRYRSSNQLSPKISPSEVEWQFAHPAPDGIGRAIRWGIDGTPDRKTDYQIWCGPITGGPQRVGGVKGTYLDDINQRKCVQIALSFLEVSVKLRTP